MASIALFSALLGLATAQSLGSTNEVHPGLTTYKCTTAGGCTPLTSYVVLDSTSHSIHQKNNTALACGKGSGVDPLACPDKETCAKNCVLEAISDYSASGVTTNGDVQPIRYNVQSESLPA
jgi:cellulase